MNQAAAKSIDEMKMEAALGETTAAGVRTAVEELSGAEGNDDRRLVIHNELGADGQEGEDAEDEFVFEEDAAEEGLRVGFSCWLGITPATASLPVCCLMIYFSSGAMEQLETSATIGTWWNLQQNVV
jgi:hypothetical protein